MPDDLPPFDNIAAGETDTRPPRTDDPFWRMLVGDAYVPSGSGIPVRHLHPLHAKPVFDAVRGTPAADVMAGLLFRNMIAWNNAQHAWDRVHELTAERDVLRSRLSAVEAALEEARRGGREAS